MGYKQLITYCLLAVCVCGCAGAPARRDMPVFNINGVPYLPLPGVCAANGINWEYDTFSRSVTLTRLPHKISLMVGDRLVLVDAAARHLKHPVEIHRGIIVVPQSFREQVIDTLFKQQPLAERPGLALTGIKKIVIDAGHGGKDPGTTGASGLREKDLNLDIAKRLSRILTQQGIEVVLTRSTDRFISLSDRVEITNRSGADLFVSVHGNANRVRSLKGFEIYYVSGAVDDCQRSLDAARKASLSIDNSYFAAASLNLKATLWDMIYTYSRGQSLELSNSICKVMKKSLDTPVLGIKEARYYVLKGARMPAVLIEIGFLSNHSEENMLKNNFYRQKIAEGIVEGISAYSRDLAVKTKGYN